MGKTVLFLAFAALLAGSFAFRQAHFDREHTQLRQTERQSELLAREIAQTGFNTVRSKARRMHQTDTTMSMDHLASMMGGPMSGPYQGGSYNAWMQPTGSASYHVVAEGRFGEAYFRMGRYTVYDVPVPSEHTWLDVEFVQSVASFCSAIYVQRALPGLALADQPAPELLFVPGRNRDGHTGRFSDVIEPGTLLNFILAVDRGCEQEGSEIASDHPTYDYLRYSFEDDVSDFSDLTEGRYVLLQEKPTTAADTEGTWRVAFEDVVFPGDRLEDIKINGYGSGRWNPVTDTYGGSGWTEVDEHGYWRLREFGESKPDFNDQVIEVVMTTLTEEELDAYREGGMEAVEALRVADEDD